MHRPAALSSLHRTVPARRPATREHRRLAECTSRDPRWKLWGPYLSERQWGTVREDYSAQGTAWEYFPHDHARSRAYRWGEDGLLGFCDHQQRLNLSIALWNESDPILKERLFGLTNHEGNHGEDVKELYYYLDATPSHAYCRMLYKYPQAAFPYQALIEGSRHRDPGAPEYELLDTGVFDDDRYFDVFAEYAQAEPGDLLLRITVHNRAAADATLHLLPQLTFRNTWSWHPNAARPLLECQGERVVAQHASLGRYECHAQPGAEWLFTENETNAVRLWGLGPAPRGIAEGGAGGGGAGGAAGGHFKDAFHEWLIGGVRAAVNPAARGTKCAAHHRLRLAGRSSAVVRLRLRCAAATTTATAAGAAAPFERFDEIVDERARDADEFYAEIQRDIPEEDARSVQRQAFAGLICSKQFFHFDVAEWLSGDPAQPPPPPERRQGRNRDWAHLNSADVISMPDKWEYPWFAAWDLAFHTIPFALIDAEFAKEQLVLLTREWAMHPNGQIPAYEWAFGDVNPPVHAWATWRVFQIDRKQHGGSGDLAFLERVFHKLMLNFTWWVNRKDAEGRNVFQGGFLGLDNIGVFDRSAQLPTGGHIDQADGTSWMAMYALNLMRIALELALHNPVYEDIASKFFEHFLHIAEAMNNLGDAGIGLWDAEDEFFYDVLHLPDGSKRPLKVRSMVGLIPLFAVETLEPDLLERLPEFKARLEWFLHHRPGLAALVSHWDVAGRGQRRLLSLLRGHRMKRLLKRMLDESEFLSPFGVRALSKHHEREPYVFRTDGCELAVRYLPGESDSGLFGGNSNWRGPIWFPVNFLLIESLQKFHHYYGDEFRIECPTGSGRYLSIAQVAAELSRRLTCLFLKDANGRRAVHGECARHARDPHFRDHLLFYEYFHGDTGRGLGASHQTGWTGLIAKLMQPRA